jgi:hypothetical protein
MVGPGFGDDCHHCGAFWTETPLSTRIIGAPQNFYSATNPLLRDPSTRGIDSSYPPRCREARFPGPIGAALISAARLQYLLLRGGIRAEESTIDWLDEVTSALQDPKRESR